MAAYVFGIDIGKTVEALQPQAVAHTHGEHPGIFGRD